VTKRLCRNEVIVWTDRFSGPFQFGADISGKPCVFIVEGKNSDRSEKGFRASAFIGFRALLATP